MRNFLDDGVIDLVVSLRGALVLYRVTGGPFTTFRPDHEWSGIRNVARGTATV